MIKKALLLYDVHLCEKPLDRSYLVVKKFLKDFKPDEVVIGGDFMDCECISHWVENKRLQVEGKRWKAEVAVANKELDYIEKYTKKITYLEGNHEAWVKQYVEKNPSMEGFVDIEENLRLRERGIKFLPYNSLYRLGKLYATHGMYTNKYHATHHVQSLGCNIVYGHVHRSQMDQLIAKMCEPHKAWSLGCLCGHEPSYLKGKPANWMNGFGVLYYDEKSGYFNLYPVDIIGGKFIWNGRLYK